MSSIQAELKTAVQYGNDFKVRNLGYELKEIGDTQTLKSALSLATMKNKAPATRGHWTSIVNILNEILSE